MPQNIEAWLLWNKCQTKWLYAGMGSIIGLDMDKVESQARRLEIDFNRCLESKIGALERYELERQSNDNSDSGIQGLGKNPKGD